MRFDDVMRTSLWDAHVRVPETGGGMLDDIRSPDDLRGYDATDLRQIADELRSETIEAVAAAGENGGTLSPADEINCS